MQLLGVPLTSTLITTSFILPLLITSKLRQVRALKLVWMSCLAGGISMFRYIYSVSSQLTVVFSGKCSDVHLGVQKMLIVMTSLLCQHWQLSVVLVRWTISTFLYLYPAIIISFLILFWCDFVNDFESPHNLQPSINDDKIVPSDHFDECSKRVHFLQ